MREVVIRVGVYGRRVAPGRVQPVVKGSRVMVPDEEATRLVALGVAAYANAPTEAPDALPVPPPAAKANPNPISTEPPTEAATGGAEAVSDDLGVTRLERMQKADLEQMAADMGLDVSGARTKHDLALLIVAAEEPDDEAPPVLDAGDIVR